MSKKTREKSSRSASKTGSAKAKTAKRSATKKPRASAAGKTAGTASNKQGTTAKKTPAKIAKRSGSKAASARKSTATKPQKKPAPSRSALAATLNEGDVAPAFSLPRDGGRLVSLAEYAGRKLVIFFYPRANTPGCTLEAIAFSRLADAFASARTGVLGISADPVTAQESFRDKHDLTVPLVSDEPLGMLKAYGVWGEKSMYGKTFMGISRTTVLINGNGKIVRIWRNVKVDGHAEEVLAAARAA
ncbi:peroxiredoxin [Bradyrhizobium sp. G127]|uniref:peroxiredoxin n=1 Tax=Bradyrhizobium sp. G127 TaxID=2904800 RepID=UPI001F3C45B1|nr:peroxiredoxin [Bradyrhizobium sp. G127]MCF2523472.1 redoxin domain-containing protein [Bradyrhizobium sp. G127]